MEEEQIGINGYPFLFTPVVKYDREVSKYDILHCTSNVNVCIEKINEDGFFRLVTDDPVNTYITRDQMEGMWIHSKDYLKELGWKVYRNGKEVN